MNIIDEMVSGKIYDASNSELAELRLKAGKLCKQYNDTYEDEIEKREEILKQLLPNRKGNNSFRGPIFFDYGFLSYFGENFYAGPNFSVLDNAPVRIGDNVMIAMNCTIITSHHPLRWQDRNMEMDKKGNLLYAPEYTKPVTIGDNCWIAANVTILGGVTIGNGCVIGAGSVVTKDIPDNSFAAGVPCKIIKEITEKDAITY